MIHEDDDQLGYWTGKPGMPNYWERRHAALCHRILGGREVGAQIQHAAMLAERGYPAEAEDARRVAGYGGLPEHP